MPLILFFVAGTLYAVPEVNIYYKRTANGYDVFADNENHSPISIAIDFDLLNLKNKDGKKRVYVVQAKEKYVKLTELIVINKLKDVKFSYNYTANYGIEGQRSYNAGYKYYLPYNTGEEYVMSQGYNGEISHQNQNALDFTMPIGTSILAARDGVVVEVVDINTKNCASQDCKVYNNYIQIYHSDGTFGEYAHLKENGATVKVGDRIKVGELIGYSGNSGWSTGPHLHFSVYLQDIAGRRTIKTNFLVGDGKDFTILNEGQLYLREY